MHRKHRKFPVCSFHGTMSFLSVKSLRFATVMKADEDSRTSRFNFLQYLTAIILSFGLLYLRTA